MSYDIEIKSACGGFYEDLGNVTWNLAPLFIWALGTDDGIRALDGMEAQSVASVLSDALSKIADASPDDLERFEPPNGSIRQECLQRPTGTVHVR